MWQPSEFLVVVHVPANAKLKTKACSLRCGSARSVEDARKLIAEEKKSLGQTYGGLIEPTDPAGRRWEIWQATWSKVE